MLKQLVAPIFERSGHRQISEELRPDVFGSPHCMFANARSKIRLVWDGKDGCGYAQLSGPDVPNDWKDIGGLLMEGDLETVPPNQTKIDRFVAAVERVTLQNATSFIGRRVKLIGPARREREWARGKGERAKGKDFASRGQL